MLNCDICEKEWLYKVIVKDNKQICSNCNNKENSHLFSTHEKVWIGGEIGWELKSRVDEAKRRVILPIERNDGESDYYLGRRGENGKTQEREPSY